MNRFIGELLHQAQDSRDGASGRRLAEIAQDAGYQIDRTQINALLAGTYKSVLRPKTLDAIAFLSDRPRDVVYALAGEPVPGGSFAEEIPEDADLLNVAQRRAVLTVIREFVADQRRGVRAPSDEVVRLGIAMSVRRDPGMEGQFAELVAARHGDVQESPTLGNQAAEGEENQDPEEGR